MIKRIRWLGLILLVAAGVALLAPGAVLALPLNPPPTGMICLNGPSFNLVATSGTINTPDGNSVFMWSYADSSGQFQYPGPVLCVNQGDTVTVNLTNNLPEPVSIIFPGQDSLVTASGGSAGLFTTEAAANGGGVSYTFVAGEPGTYLYESGSDPTKQVEMGLYGVLVVRPVMGANYAYDDASSQFDPTREYLILLADMDPDLHHAVETGGSYDYTLRHDRYYTVNGRNFPDTLLENGTNLLPAQPYGALVRIQPTTLADQPALVRMVNAGMDNHPYHPHGNHMTQIAQDARLLLSPEGSSASSERFGETIGSGQTEDYLIRWDTSATDSGGVTYDDYWNPNTNQFPVAQPNYRELTFKDGRTWYSGNPYLGYKGTLPTGVVSQNLCGEWYFPWHSHALNEFTNFDEGFGGMATLLRVDPAGGCFTFPASAVIVGGTLKSGSVSALAAQDNSYYQVNVKSTTLGTAMPSGTPATTLSNSVDNTQTSILVASNSGFPAAPYYVQIGSEILRVTAKSNPSSRTWAVSRGQLGTTAAAHASASSVTYANVIDVASAAGFPATGNYFIRMGNEVLQVTAGQGTTSWTVSRGQLATSAAAHSSGTSVMGLETDWYAGFSGVQAGSQNLKITYVGKNCANASGSSCTAIAAPIPSQTLKICDWTISGAAGCATQTSNGWVTLPVPPSQPQSVGSTDVSSTWTLPGSGANYIGTGTYAGQVRVLVDTTRWTAPNPTPFSTWGNLMQLTYDAP
jgi:hypothetical protein